jgi:hypothetical protein
VGVERSAQAVADALRGGLGEVPLGEGGEAAQDAGGKDKDAHLGDDAEVAHGDALVDSPAEQGWDDEGKDRVEDDADVGAGREVPVGTQEGKQTEERSQHPAFRVDLGPLSRATH